MKVISISDMTIKEAAGSADMALTFKEQMAIARALDSLGVDVIELPAADSKSGALLVKALSPVINKATISVEAGLSIEEVKAAAEALSGAKKGRICVSVPTSPVQMEYHVGLKPAKISAKLVEVIKAAKESGFEVEFSAVDATRSDAEFLASLINEAIDNGASVINLRDSAGLILPEEYVKFVNDVCSKVEKIANDEIKLSVTCPDNMGMALANAFSLINTYADEIVTSLFGRAAASTDGVVNMVSERGESFNVSTAIARSDMAKTVRMMHLTEDNTSKKFSFDTGEVNKSLDDIKLDSDADIARIIKTVKAMGYELSDDDNAKVYKEFKRVCEKKSVIGVKEMEAIIATTALQVPPTYQLDNFVINSGNVITPTAQVTLLKDGNKLQGLSSGDGPIAAAFLAVEMVVGCHYELDEFSIQAVTEGSGAVGNTLVKLRANGKLYSGSGVSTDIIGASIRAYLNAINKIVYEEK